MNEALPTTRHTAHNVPVHHSSKGDAHGRYYNPVVMSYIRDDWIRQQLDSRMKEYTSYHGIQILSGTWNVNGKKPLQDTDQLGKWLNSKDADVVVVGFQEIVDLNAVNVVVTNLSHQRSSQWIEVVSNTLNKRCENEEYIMIMEKHLVGILLVVFVKAKHVEYVEGLQGTSAGVGVMGMMGNKGGVSIRFQLYKSTFCFVCAHLAAHRENVAGRNADFANIIAKTEFQTQKQPHHRNTISNLSANRNHKHGHGFSHHHHTHGGKTFGILDHEYVIWIGDLNYRIVDSTPIEQCFQLVQSNALRELSAMDQLNMERAQGNAFRGFQEGKLSFPPTYKFQPGTSLYERRPEKKTRAPAWCDRILWKVLLPAQMELRSYESVGDLILSDHKPVKASFLAQAKFEVVEKKAVVMKDIMHQLDKWENENMPKVTIDGNTISCGKVYYGVPMEHSIWIENTGQVVAHFRFVPKLDEKKLSKPWLLISPVYGMIPPMERIEIKIIVHVTSSTALALNEGTDTLDDMLILKIENGRDYFVIVSGSYQRSCFGTSLNHLIQVNQPARTYSKTGVEEEALEASTLPKVPKELWRIIDDLYKTALFEPNLWTSTENEHEAYTIREALDNCTSFPQHSPSSMAHTLLVLLGSFQQPILPEKLIFSCEDDPMRIQLNGRAVLNGLCSAHYNVFVYIISFLRELLKHSEQNQCTASMLATAFAPTLSKLEQESFSSSKEVMVHHLLVHFLTTTSL